jgi:hypothetical protein
MTLVAWAPEEHLVIGAISLSTTQILNRETYLLLLSNRLTKLGEDVDQSDLNQISDLLVEAGLLYSPLDPQESMGSQILADNERMQEHFRDLGIPGHLPQGVATSNEEAQTALDQTSLLGWTLEAVSGRIRRE